MLVSLHTKFDNCLSTGRVLGIPASSAVIKAVVLVCLHTKFDKSPPSAVIKTVVFVCLHTKFDHCLSTGRVLGTVRVKGLLN